MTNNGKTASVVSRDGLTTGVASNLAGYRCQMEGCTGRRLVVKWPDGKSTRPCTKGMFTRPDGNLQIG
ncbi:hypothetical protein [Paucibacter soli]|uniref:hypothetical protein n=1 Tax=Paucibacter soli TaxID=3133433 RepID=UPI0030AA4575